jgi:4-amino-4-deoxy-L-arabinose transferase-like glycosyltransferase
MRFHPRRALRLLALLVVIATVYLFRLGSDPIYLAHDEVFFGLHGASIASTAHDAFGRFLPLYFSTSPNVWFQPVPVYFTAAILAFLPLTEAAVRLPTVLVALIDIVAMYWLGWKIFGRESRALLGAALLALTPAHFIHARIAMDYLYPVAFLMLWLVCLLIFLERRRLWILFLATFLLGVGFYSYIAAVLMMPLYLLCTWWVLAREERHPTRAMIVALLGFIIPLLPAVPWMLEHSTTFSEQATRYGLHQWRFFALTERVTVYWNFFNPSYLFLTGGLNLMNSTRRVGVFLLPFAVFIPLGLKAIATSDRTTINTLLLIGFLSAPVAASLVPELYAVDRELELLPFGVAVAMLGVDRALTGKSVVPRQLVFCLLALIPIQFYLFCADYFGSYRLRTAGWFDNNVRSALEQIITREPRGNTSRVYLSREIPFVDWYWKFYVRKHGREDLLPLTVYFDRTFDVSTAPSRSLVLAKYADAERQAQPGSSELRRIALISEPDLSVSFTIFER